MTARRWFHFLLGSVFASALALPPLWGGAIYWLRRAVGDDRRWAKRILYLAVVDTVVVCAAVFVVWRHYGEVEHRAPAEKDRVAIGVTLDPEFHGAGARILHVEKAGPAKAAGVREGDIVLQVGGREAKDLESLRELVAQQRAGTSVRLEVARGSTTATLEVTPQWYSKIPRAKVGLFEPIGPPESCFRVPSAPRLWPSLLILAAITGVGLVARRRGAGAPVAWTACALLGGGIGSYAAYGGSCAALGGPTGAAVVFLTWGSSLGIACVAALGLRLSLGRTQVLAPTVSTQSAVGLGTWYTLAGTIRLMVLLTAIRELISASSAWGASPLDAIAQRVGMMEGPGLLLLALPVVVFAPIGEELAFRGLFQPALSKWMTPFASIALTAVIFASLHWVYGLMLPIVVLYGAVLGWARWVTGRLTAPILLHALINATYFLGLWLRAG